MTDIITYPNREQEVLVMFKSIKELLGYTLFARDGRIGVIRDFLFNCKKWGVCYLVADLSDILPGRKVLIPPPKFAKPDEEKFDFPVGLTLDEVMGSPTLAIDEKEYKAHEKELCQHFGWDPCWMVDSRETDKSAGMVMGECKTDPEMRSSREIIGYKVQAKDGLIGYVDDFLVDDNEWVIRYVVIDIHNWLPGKKVLVETSWVERADWERFMVYIPHAREDIKNSPIYDPEELALS